MHLYAISTQMLFVYMQILHNLFSEEGVNVCVIKY